MTGLGHIWKTGTRSHARLYSIGKRPVVPAERVTHSGTLIRQVGFYICSMSSESRGLLRAALTNYNFRSNIDDLVGCNRKRSNGDGKEDLNFALSRSRGPPDLRVYVVGFAFGSSSVVAKGRGFIGGGFAGFGPLFCFFEKKCCNPIRVTARSLPAMIDGTGTFSLEFPQILKGNVNTRNYTGT
ncbi:hypothetical protein HZH66_005458 [Vespula vulgaris]|uniref:Uncharacterized protein n=1 Tax=Vespula vulgaris TaxID=7454 RepID=A0A834K8F0_VESVU|nr:hypothetical protein HZH66_005458 [Vespula vulgaris]